MGATTTTRTGAPRTGEDWTPIPTPQPTTWTRRRSDVFGVIEVGADRARLDVFRRGLDGMLVAVWRDEEAFPEVVQGMAEEQRLVETLRRFQRVCGRHHMTVGALAHASDALNNHPEKLPRLFRMTGVSLKQVSERENARLLCLGLLRGEIPGQKTLVVDVGPEGTLVILANGEEPVALWRLGVGTATTPATDAHGEAALLRRLRADVRHSLQATRLDAVRGATRRALTGREALQRSNARTVQALRTRAILEEVAAYLRLDGIRAVDRGLREGILFDLCRATDGGTA